MEKKYQVFVSSTYQVPVASFYHAEPSKLPAEKVESTDMGKQKQHFTVSCKMLFVN